MYSEKVLYGSGSGSGLYSGGLTLEHSTNSCIWSHCPQWYWSKNNRAYNTVQNLRYKV